MKTDFLPKTIFVTGGSGYIGRNILRALVKRGDNVRALVRSDAAAKVVSAIGAKAIHGDLLDESALVDAMQGCTFMLHLAADTSHSGMNPAQVQTNLKGTSAVFKAAKAAGVKRAIHLSSEAVLLDGTPLINASEDHPIPTSFPGGYSSTKAMAEMIALGEDAPSFQVLTLRPRFVWGRDDTSALPQLIKAAKSGKLAWIDGGHYLTSTTHIDNLVHAAMLALENGKSGEAYFVTDLDPVPFRDFITQMLATQGVEAPTKEVPRWLVKPIVKLGEAVGKLTGGLITGPMSLQEYATLGVEVTLNIAKARIELKYVPQMSIEDGMAQLRDAEGKR